MPQESRVPNAYPAHMCPMHAPCITPRHPQALRARWVALQLVGRVLTEIRRHRHAFAKNSNHDANGNPKPEVDEEDVYLKQVQALVACDSGSLDSSQFGACGGCGSCHVRQEQGSGTAQAGPGGLLDGLPHLRPSESLLHLEG